MILFSKGLLTLLAKLVFSKLIFKHPKINGRPKQVEKCQFLGEEFLVTKKLWKRRSKKNYGENFATTTKKHLKTAKWNELLQKFCNNDKKIFKSGAARVIVAKILQQENFFYPSPPPKKSRLFFSKKKKCRFFWLFLRFWGRGIKKIILTTTKKFWKRRSERNCCKNFHDHFFVTSVSLTQNLGTLASLCIFF